jgi:hypothetical protein
MFPLRILRVGGLAGSSVVRGFVGTGMYSTFLLGVLYLQHVHGYGALQTGLAFLPLTLIIGLFSLGVTARLMRQFGATRVVLAGLAAIAAALVLLSRLPTHTSYFPTIALPFALLGLGAGLSFLPLTTIAMADVPIADAGLASGIVNASQQISVAIGTAALGTVAAERAKVLAGLGQHHLQALTGGFHLGWAVGRRRRGRRGRTGRAAVAASPAAAAGGSAHRPRPRAGRARAGGGVMKRVRYMAGLALLVVSSVGMICAGALAAITGSDGTYVNLGAHGSYPHRPARAGHQQHKLANGGVRMGRFGAAQGHLCGPEAGLRRRRRARRDQPLPRRPRLHHPRRAHRPSRRPHQP